MAGTPLSRCLRSLSLTSRDVKSERPYPSMYAGDESFSMFGSSSASSFKHHHLPCTAKPLTGFWNRSVKPSTGIDLDDLKSAEFTRGFHLSRKSRRVSVLKATQRHLRLSPAASHSHRDTATATAGRRSRSTSSASYLNLADVMPWPSMSPPRPKAKKSKHSESPNTKTHAHAVVGNAKTTGEPGHPHRKRQPRKTLKLEAAVYQHAQPSPGARCADDAHLIEGNWVGLADGLSCWAEQGINSGLYCQELLWNCTEAIRGSGFSDIEDEEDHKHEANEGRMIRNGAHSHSFRFGSVAGPLPEHPDATAAMGLSGDMGCGTGFGLGGIGVGGKRQRKGDACQKSPCDVLLDAQMRTELKGSCTATLASLGEEYLHICTLGSSSFVLLRQGMIVGQSLPAPDALETEGLSVNRASAAEEAPRVMEYCLPVQSGDVLVLGTAELFKDLCARDMAEIVGEATEQGWCAEGLAKRLTCTATKKHQCAEVTASSSEVAKGAGRHPGSKVEEMTTLVALVT